MDSRLLEQNRLFMSWSVIFEPWIRVLSALGLRNTVQYRYSALLG